MSQHLSTARVRIGFVTPCLALGGVEVLTLGQIRHARDLQWIGTWLPADAPRIQDTVARFPMVGTSQSSLSDLLARSDVILTWGGPTLSIEQCLGRGVPVIYGVHGMGQWSRAQLMAVIDRVDLIWCVSRAAMDIVPADYLARTRLIPGGAEPPSATMSRDEIRAEWGIGAGEIATGFIGRLSSEKRPGLIASAVASRPEFRFVCCSPHARDHANPLRAEIDGLLGERATWISAAPGATGDVLAGLDCLIMASDQEGIPLVTIEAWAMSVPVVSTPVGIVPDLERSHGPLVETIPMYPSSTEILDAIEAAIAAPQSQLENARNLAMGPLHIERMTRDFEAMALGLARIPSSPARIPRPNRVGGRGGARRTTSM